MLGLFSKNDSVSADQIGLVAGADLASEANETLFKDIAKAIDAIACYEDYDSSDLPLAVRHSLERLKERDKDQSQKKLEQATNMSMKSCDVMASVSRIVISVGEATENTNQMTRSVSSLEGSIEEITEFSNKSVATMTSTAESLGREALVALRRSNILLMI